MAQDMTKLPVPGGPIEPAKPNGGPNGEDEVEASKAPLLDHLAELRTRTLWACAAILAMFVLCFAFARTIYNILLVPYQQAARNDTVFDHLYRFFDPAHAAHSMPDTPIEMIYTGPWDFFFAEMTLAFFGAIFLAFPIIATQIYMFVAPGLYKNEKRAFLPYLFATPVLFLLGASLVYFLAMPLALKFFLSMQQSGASGEVKITALFTVEKYLSMVTTLIIGFGVMFQLPVVLTLLARAGMVTADFLRKGWRYAYVGIVGAAAVLAPPDPLSMIGMALPTVLLYEGSILAVRYVEQQNAIAQAKRDAAGT